MNYYYDANNYLLGRIISKKKIIVGTYIIY